MNAPGISPEPSPPARAAGRGFFFAGARVAGALVLGVLVGVLAHYLIYRFSLPAKPFIYAAF